MLSRTIRVSTEISLPHVYRTESERNRRQGDSGVVDKDHKAPRMRAVSSGSLLFGTTTVVMLIMLLTFSVIHTTTAFTPKHKGGGMATAFVRSTFVVLHQFPPFHDENDNRMNGAGSEINGSSNIEDNLKNVRSHQQHQHLNGTSTSPWLYTTHSDHHTTTTLSSTSTPNNNQQQQQMLQRITQLEELVAKQAVDIARLQSECEDLVEVAASFARVVELLRQSGLSTNLVASASDDNTSTNENHKTTKDKNKVSQKEEGDDDSKRKTKKPSADSLFLDQDSEIFGKAPASVLDAADAAGAAILAALLGGQQRLLVDVRDAELTSSNEALVQFIELAILPVAAGLEGLYAKRNRLKIVFPTVKQLLEYRKTMALSAPDVVALSTLNLDPVEKQDNLVVIVAPAPNDEEGLAVMNQLLSPTNATSQIRQPIVVFNPHMIPLQGPAADFEVAYHLRLLSVQYMASSTRPGTNFLQRDDFSTTKRNDRIADSAPEVASDQVAQQYNSSTSEQNDAALEAAMQHAKQVPGPGSGTTRAMIIRAYPNPWHVFVDTSPDTDADFRIAGIFEKAPTLEEIQLSIIECLEGTEEQDELVAQQMQRALELGQLDRISEMLSEFMGKEEVDLLFDGDDDDDDDDSDDPWGLNRGVDSV